jgi:branched-chain amino acid transport system permease protein
MSRARSGEVTLFLGASVLVVVLPRLFPSDAAITLMCQMGVMSVWALSYNMLAGQTGLLSFGHSLYFGMGAFAAVHAANYVVQSGLPVPLAALPLAGSVAGLLLGSLFGWFSTRRGGTAFAMISLGLGELVFASAQILQGFFGGEQGIATDRARLIPLFGHHFGRQVEVYYLIAFWTVLCAALMYGITRAPFGRACNAVRENEERAEFIGYDPQMVRFIAFVLSSGFAGTAGALATINFELVGANMLSSSTAGLVLLMTYIGGITVFLGPVLGAVLITFLQTMLSDVSSNWLLYFGLLFILVIMYLPKGICGWLTMHGSALRAGKFHKLLPSYLSISLPLAVLCVSGVALLEMMRKALVGAADNFRIASLTINPADPAFWLSTSLLFLAACGLLRRLWPRVTQAWTAVEGREP